MSKILWFDCETTGLDPVKQDIIQLAGIIEVDGEIVDEFEFKIKPISFDSISQEALDVHGYGIEQLKEFPDPKEIHNELLKHLGAHCDKFDKNDKYYPGGYNVNFDLDFLSNHFKKLGDKYLGSWINWRRIDPLPIVNVMALKNEIDLPNHKLETLANAYGIEIKAHDALSDVKATLELFKKLTE